MTQRTSSRKRSNFGCNKPELSFRKEVIMSRHDETLMAATLHTFSLFSLCCSLMFHICEQIKSQPCFSHSVSARTHARTHAGTHAPRRRPYSSSNINGARLPTRPHTVPYISLPRQRPTSVKAPHVALIFHYVSSGVSGGRETSREATETRHSHNTTPSRTSQLSPLTGWSNWTGDENRCGILTFILEGSLSPRC